MIKPENRWLILGVVAGCYLPVAADATILNLAIPSLNSMLGTNSQEILWIADIYPLSMVGLVLLSGPLGDRFGHQRLLLSGLVVFGLASMACAFAPTPEVLIGARAGLAAGAAAIIPATLSIIRQVFEDSKERVFAIGVWSAVAAGGAAAGPPLGGVLIEYFWWGAVFLINVPIAAVAFAYVHRLLANQPATHPQQWEALSPLLGMGGVVAVVYVIQAAAHTGSSPVEIVLPLFLGVAALALFTRRQLRSPAPMLDLRLFTGRRFRLGVLLAVVPVLVLVGFELLLAQELQFALGLTPLQAGLLLLPLPLGAFVAGPLGGYLVAQFGMRIVVPTALVTAAVGYGGLFLGATQHGAWITLCLLFIGLGHGAVMTTASDVIMTSAPAERAGGAASVESVSYELGAGLGIAVLGSVMASLYSARFPTSVAEQAPEASHSIGEAMTVAERGPSDLAGVVAAAARDAFTVGFRLVALGACVVLVAVAVFGTMSALREHHTDAHSSPGE